MSAKRFDKVKVFDVINALRGPEESWFDTAKRLGLEEALRQSAGQQKRAGEILGVSPRVMTYYVSGTKQYGPRISFETATELLKLKYDRYSK